MSSLKRFTAVFLAVLMLASLAVTGVFADEPAGALKVNVTSNFGASSSNTYNADDTVSISFTLRSEYPIANIQGYLAYDSSVLALESFALDEQFPETVYNTNLYNKATFNSTNTTNEVDYGTEAHLATADFKVLDTATGEVSVSLVIEELNFLNQQYEIVPIISDSVAADSSKVGGSVSFDAPVTPTDPTTPTEPAPETKITVKAAKTQIYVGATTTVTATVTNKVGDTKFKSNNTKVATVTSAGKVTGKSAGTVTITATNNGKSASVKIKIIKKANTMKVTAAKKTVKYSALKKKAQTIKAVTVKNAKGKVTYKKKSGKSSFTVNKTTGKITVKKGTKKGTYTVSVSVTAAGTTAYNKATKVAKVKITVK